MVTRGQQRKGTFAVLHHWILTFSMYIFPQKVNENCDLSPEEWAYKHAEKNLHTVLDFTTFLKSVHWVPSYETSALSCFYSWEIFTRVTEATRAYASKVKWGGYEKCFGMNIKKYCTQHSLWSSLAKNGKPKSNKAFISTLQVIWESEEYVKNTLGIQSAKSKTWEILQDLCFLSRHSFWLY